MREILDEGYSDYTTDKRLTFAGVLRSYFEEYAPDGKKIGISKGWNEKTTNTYIRDYNLRLFPHLDPWKGLEDYTEEEFDQIIEKIQAENEYAEGTTARYRHLIYVVCEAGHRHAHCDNIPWRANFDTEILKGEHIKGNKLVRMKKSFTPLQDLMIAHELFDNPCIADGEDVGLLLMYCCAFRNSEACGLNYGHLVEMKEHPGCYMLMMFQTAGKKRGHVKSGGKTRNANRILPIMDKLRDYLLKRKGFIQQKIEDGTVKNWDGSTPDISKFPLACRGQKYKVRCLGKDLTKRGQMLFEKVGLNQGDLQDVESQLAVVKSQAKDVWEKDATAYLFRRHAGTMLHILGLSMPQIQYYMGQDVEDVLESRNGYTNEHKLIEIKRVLESHPILYLTKEVPPAKELSPEQPVYVMPKSAAQCYQLPLERSGVRITLSAREVLDTIEVNVRSLSGTSIDIEVLDRPGQPNTERTVNVERQLVEKYQMTYDRMSKKKKCR